MGFFNRNRGPGGEPGDENEEATGWGVGEVADVAMVGVVGLTGVVPLMAEGHEVQVTQDDEGNWVDPHGNVYYSEPTPIEVGDATAEVTMGTDGPFWQVATPNFVPPDGTIPTIPGGAVSYEAHMGRPNLLLPGSDQVMFEAAGGGAMSLPGAHVLASPGSSAVEMPRVDQVAYVQNAPEAAPADEASLFIGRSYAPTPDVEDFMGRRSAEIVHTGMRDVYVQVAGEADVPAWALAALHMREANNDPNRSMLAGEPIGAVNPDSGRVEGANIVENVRIAAHKLRGLGQAAYGVTITGRSTLAEVSLAMHAYNRGSMYSRVGASPWESPYLMNRLNGGLNNMHWPNHQGEPSSVRGEANEQIGTVPMFIFLTRLWGGVTETYAEPAPLPEATPPPAPEAEVAPEAPAEVEVEQVDTPAAPTRRQQRKMEKAQRRAGQPSEPPAEEPEDLDALPAEYLPEPGQEGYDVELADMRVPADPTIHEPEEGGPESEYQGEVGDGFDPGDYEYEPEPTPDAPTTTTTTPPSTTTESKPTKGAGGSGLADALNDVIESAPDVPVAEEAPAPPAAPAWESLSNMEQIALMEARYDSHLEMMYDALDVALETNDLSDLNHIVTHSPIFRGRLPMPGTGLDGHPDEGIRYLPPAALLDLEGRGSIWYEFTTGAGEKQRYATSEMVSLVIFTAHALRQSEEVQTQERYANVALRIGDLSAEAGHETHNGSQVDLTSVMNYDPANGGDSDGPIAKVSDSRGGPVSQVTHPAFDEVLNFKIMEKMLAAHMEDGRYIVDNIIFNAESAGRRVPYPERVRLLSQHNDHYHVQGTRRYHGNLKDAAVAYAGDRPEQTEEGLGGLYWELLSGFQG